MLVFDNISKLDIRIQVVATSTHVLYFTDLCTPVTDELPLEMEILAILRNEKCCFEVEAVG